MKPSFLLEQSDCGFAFLSLKKPYRIECWLVLVDHCHKYRMHIRKKLMSPQMSAKDKSKTVSRFDICIDPQSIEIEEYLKSGFLAYK